MNKRMLFLASVATAVLFLPSAVYARWMNPSSGRFITMDSYEGDGQDPGSLNKYAYCHCDPVNNIDPEGEDITEVMTTVFNTYTLLGIPVYPTTRVAQRALITGGTAANLKKRRRIDEIARRYNGSHLWDYAVRKDNFPRNSNKCNKFVYDVSTEAGAQTLITVGGTPRPPLAAEYADRNTRIPSWRPLGPGENPQPGDIAAYRISGGRAAFSGHSGFIVMGGNMSAHDDGVYPRPGQFENRRDTGYRRYTGE